MKIIFDWDRNKARINTAKHRISFEEARTIFLDRLTLTRRDEEHSDEEDRLISIGLSSAGRLLMVVHTEIYEIPDILVVRIISVRKATTAEHTRYEKQQE